jgi:WD40 repeat protein
VQLAFSPDGRLFAAAGLNGLVTVWDVATRQPRPIGRGYRNALHDVTFSPDSRRLLATGTSSKDPVKLWDVQTGRDVATLPGEPGWFSRIGFSPDEAKEKEQRAPRDLEDILSPFAGFSCVQE